MNATPTEKQDCEQCKEMSQRNVSICLSLLFFELVADPESSRWFTNPGRGAPYYTFGKTLQRLHENGRNWTKSEVVLPYTPLDTPL